MDPLGALIRLSEVTLLTDTGQGEAAALKPTDTGAALPIGKLVTAQVVDATGSPTLVNIAGKPYALNIPFAVRTGQVLDLQVSEVTPGLQFRLLSTSQAPAARNLSAGLGAFHPDAGTPQMGTPQMGTPQGGTSQANAAQAQLAPTPLVSATELTAVPDLGNFLGVQIKRQFEGQTPSPVQKTTQQAGPVAIAPSAARGTASSEAVLTASSAALASAVTGPLTRNASAEQEPTPTGVAPISDSPAVRPNPVASTLEPAAWNGPIWSGQDASITIEPDQRRTPFEAPALNRWNATLRLTLPNLGQLNAQVDWSTPGLSIRIMASDADSATLLRSHSGELVDTLRSLEMRIQAIGVSHGE